MNSFFKLNNRLKPFRQEQRLTQTELADMIGSSKNTMLYTIPLRKGMWNLNQCTKCHIYVNLYLENMFSKILNVGKEYGW